MGTSAPKKKGRNRRCYGSGSKREKNKVTISGLVHFPFYHWALFFGTLFWNMKDLKVVLQSIRWFPGFTPVAIKCSVGFTQLFFAPGESLAVFCLGDSPSQVYLGQTRSYIDHSHHLTPCTHTSKGQEGSGLFASSSRYPFLTHKHVIMSFFQFI